MSTAVGFGGSSPTNIPASVRLKGPNIDDYLTKEVQAVLSTVLETYCGVISRLVLRSLRKQGPRNGEKNDTDPHKVENSSSGAAISDILQILGILSHLESLGLIVFLDERIWRRFFSLVKTLAVTLCTESA